MYDMFQDSTKCDQIKDVILTMIQRLNYRIEKWPDEDTEIIYEYDGIRCSRKNQLSNETKGVGLNDQN